MIKKIRERGFTMIEMIAAIFIVTVGVIGIFILIQQTISFITISSSRLVAFYLAQEGIEIVRNIRDSNILKIHQEIEGVEWDTGLTDCDLGCEADYDDWILVSNDRYLKIDGGFYNYDLGNDTRFKRKIIIIPDSDVLSVSVEVSWQERNRTHQVTTKENLYCWYQ